MRDGFLIQTLPFFTGALAFLPGCSSSSNNDPTETTETPTTSVSATDPSTSTTDEPTTTTSPTSPTSSSETLTTAVDTTDTGDLECGAGTCGSPADAGWFGPAVYARVTPGAALPSCTPEYPDAGPTLLDGFQDPGPAACECSCELTQAPNCNPNFRGTMDLIGNYCGYNSVAVTPACTNQSFVRAQVSAFGYGAGVCEETESEEIPPIPWNATIRTCRVPENALSCSDGGVCLPAQPEGFEDNWCMYKQGDHECPAGPYGNKSIFWSGAEDTRGCSNCTCGTSGTSCSDTQVEIYDLPNCEGAPSTTITAGGACMMVTGQSFAGSSASASCPVTTMAEPVGSVAPMGEFTFCCAE